MYMGKQPYNRLFGEPRNTDKLRVTLQQRHHSNGIGHAHCTGIVPRRWNKVWERGVSVLWMPLVIYAMWTSLSLCGRSNWLLLGGSWWAAVKVWAQTVAIWWGTNVLTSVNCCWQIPSITRSPKPRIWRAASCDQLAPHPGVPAQSEDQPSLNNSWYLPLCHNPVYHLATHTKQLLTNVRADFLLDSIILTVLKVKKPWEWGYGV